MSLDGAYPVRVGADLNPQWRRGLRLVKSAPLGTSGPAKMSRILERRKSSTRTRRRHGRLTVHSHWVPLEFGLASGGGRMFGE
jgi:hypothetical protein